ncbi:cytochrome c [Enterobacteriaceae bacterium BIT-l23]|uniref:cytochrome c n=1 Tax=Jejubacter sp. L23 TaxID=3092086 RepID=UPI00158517DF|nr:cytochrome c [Enterobacteriaceae bacterium BIT-l23]
MNLKKWSAGVAGVAVIAVVVGMALTSHSTIDPVSPPQAGHFSHDEIARGQQLYQAGDCAVCHTRPGGKRDAGGLALNSPMGAIYSTNITPDPQYGIGGWSFEAFRRAMREGIDREGNHLYPAFPYTAYTHVSDGDLKALYAWLMTRPAVHEAAPETDLGFPFNIRRGIWLWNQLFLDKGPLPVARVPEGLDPARWERGRYLVEGLGHCSACHSPRNLLFAEKGGESHLGGGEVDGWVAPALNAQSPAPHRWQEEDLYQFLKTGYSQRHGATAGPMAPVIKEGTSALAESDLRAIATYIAGLQKDRTDRPLLPVKAIESATLRSTDSEGARLYSGACMACHAQSLGADMHGVRPSLQQATQFHLATPDNAIRAVLDGVTEPASDGLGTMPGFRHNMNDSQVAALLNFIRQQVAGQPAWPNLEQRVQAIRAERH